MEENRTDPQTADVRRYQTVFSPRHQRFALVAGSILAQAAVFALMLTAFSRYFAYFYWLCVLVSVGVSLFISTRKTKLAYKMAWIVPILVLPIVGGAMYLILGGGRKPKFEKAATARRYRRHLTGTVPEPDLTGRGPDCVQQVRYLRTAALCPAYRNTETRYFPTGAAFFPVLLEELERAERYIFLEYFVVAGGELWSQVLDVLIRKAQAGVDVRLMYDGVGSAPTLPARYDRTLGELGIQCRPFQPFRPVLSIHQNNRDHRKILIVDGVTGAVGGMNLADEYIGKKERFGEWKDNALLLRGEAVWSLVVFFLDMWDRGEGADYDAFRPAALPPVNAAGGLVVPYADTPMPSDTICADLYLQMITKAKEYLYITTPYLIIDETMTAALSTAARSGVDVRILTPHIPDKKVVFQVTRSNYPVLLEAGVKIYEFTPGFLHSKVVVSDDRCASVGSCNLDYRSFYLQFENGVWLWGDPAVAAIRDDVLATLARCREVTLRDTEQTPRLTRFLNVFYRLFAPTF